MISGGYEITNTLNLNPSEGIGTIQKVALIGGVANNMGFIDSMKRNLGFDLLIPNDIVAPELVTALGATLVAQDRLGE